MAFLSSMNVVGSGLTAQQLRLDVVSENITNRTTTRTEGAEPTDARWWYLRRRESAARFRAALDRALGRGASGTAGGVRVTEIVEDPSDFKLVYDPEHPDANAEGYVEMPNVDLMQEMADAMAASQAYSANVTAFNVLKQVAAKGLEIGK